MKGHQYVQKVHGEHWGKPQMYLWINTGLFILFSFECASHETRIVAAGACAMTCIPMLTKCRNGRPVPEEGCRLTAVRKLSFLDDIVWSFLKTELLY